MSIPASSHIVLIEDDPAIASTVVYALQRAGFATTHCQLLHEGWQRISHTSCAAVVLDIGLPDGNGLDFCRQLRSHASTAALPVLILSARADEFDRVLGLDMGADDYLPKPFSPRELVARVRALLRRSTAAMPLAQQGQQIPMQADVLPAPIVVMPPASLSSSLTAPLPIPTLAAMARQDAASPALWHDAAGQRIYLHGQPLELTRMEYGLLACLMQHAGRILERGWLFEHVWGEQATSADRTVDTHIKTLRAKLRSICPQTDYITTHRGMGYSIHIASK